LVFCVWFLLVVNTSASDGLERLVVPEMILLGLCVERVVKLYRYSLTHPPLFGYGTVTPLLRGSILCTVYFIANLTDNTEECRHRCKCDLILGKTTSEHWIQRITFAAETNAACSHGSADTHTVTAKVTKNING